MNSHRPLRSFRVLAVAAVVVLAAACSHPVNSPTPTASAAASTLAGTPNPSADQAAYAAIEAQVESLRGLNSTATITPILLDEKGVRDYMTKAFADQTDHVALAAQSRMFSDIGLLPAGASLEKLMIDLESSQVIGFYDSETKKLYLLSTTGGVGPEEKLTFSHEFTHALQDQNFGLEKLMGKATDQSDRSYAVLSLVEGDATLSMSQWAQKNMSVLDLLSVSGSAGSEEQTAQLAAAPAILRETLLFPYEQGLTFVQSVFDKGGWTAVNKMFANLPSSTSQILHPELYQTGVKPVAITMPAVPHLLGSGWKLVNQDTQGELQLRIWLEGEQPTSTERDAAATAVAKWGGDRVGLYEGPNGAWAVLMRTNWRSDDARLAFMSAASSRLDAMPSPSRICSNALSGRVDIAIASSEAYLPSFLACNAMD